MKKDREHGKHPSKNTRSYRGGVGKDVMFGWVAVVLWKKDREHSSLLQRRGW